MTPIALVTILWTILLSAQCIIRAPVPEDSPPGMPEALELYQDSVNSFVALWTPPRQTDTIVRGYKLGVGIHVPDEKVIILSAETRYHRIASIRHSFVYVVSLRAFNNVGDGRAYWATLFTEAAVTTTPAPLVLLLAPNKTMASTRSATTILFSWSDPNWMERPPPEDKFYVVRYNPESSVQDYIYVNATQQSILIGGLKPDTEYYFRVMVGLSEEMQFSDWSHPHHNKTLGAAPSTAPRNLLVSRHGSGVAVRWLAPILPNSPFSELKYTVMYTSDPLQGHWVLQHTGNRLRVNIPGLTQGATYYFKVACQNSHGYGPLSETRVYQLTRLRQ